MLDTARCTDGQPSDTRRGFAAAVASGRPSGIPSAQVGSDPVDALGRLERALRFAEARLAKHEAVFGAIVFAMLAPDERAGIRSIVERLIDQVDELHERLAFAVADQCRQRQIVYYNGERYEL